jgi:myo-inositol-1(or 4)-monophosphatase
MPAKTAIPVDIEYARSVAVAAAEAAGTLLRGGSTIIDLGIQAKGTTGDVVTKLDLAAERLIIERIRDAFPSHRIVAEESGLLGADDSPWVWLVDPLDGTNNLVIGLNTYVVGIALCENRRPVLGVVHDPVAGQTWSAVRGGGTRGPTGVITRQPRRQVSAEPVLAWTQGYGVGRIDGTAQTLRAVLECGARRVLQLWAPLLSWVMLARGDIDGFIGYRPEAIDLPAGSLIAQEAGIVVSTFDGSPFNEDFELPDENRSFVAGRPEVIPQLFALVRAAQRAKLGAGEQQCADTRAQGHDGQAETGEHEFDQRNPQLVITTRLQA